MSVELYKQLMSSAKYWLPRCSESLINTELSMGLDSYIRNYPTWYTSRSRTLEQNLRVAITKYDYNEHAYAGARPLLALYELVTENKIRFETYFKPYSSEEAETLDFGKLMADIVSARGRNTMPAQDTHLIHLVVVPKGKTYVRKVLDETENLNRLKGIETIAIEGINHFVRVYKGMLGNIEDITVFSDYYSEDFIHTLILQIPNLFTLVPINTEGITETPEITDRNNKILALREIYKVLFNMQRSAYTSIGPDVLLQLKQPFIEFTKLFNFKEKHTQDFLGNLAMSRQKKAVDYHKNNVERTQRDITSKEAELNQLYERLAQEQLAMNAFNKIGTEDVSEFANTLNTNKLIEVLSTDKYQMQLRITAPLQFFQTSDFEVYMKNPSSYINRTCSIEQKGVLHKIFVTHEYKLNMQSVVELKINNDTYSSNILICSAKRDTDLFTSFPNPHMFHHNCWGQAITEINKFIANGDYNLAVLQMIAATQSINVAESITFVSMLQDIFERESLRNLVTITTKENKTLTWNQAVMLESTPITEPLKEQVEETPKEYTQEIVSDWEPLTEAEVISEAIRIQNTNLAIATEENTRTRIVTEDFEFPNEYQRTVDDEYIPEETEEEEN